eukprot:TRINITY_DN5679_c0_g1_i1.p1 TRINITY_DN5679_c0_g1~~TRINITY_DN5679_c0_g1_i1.p1  ORF type:complete len:278 (+),score=39.85 TRINITY_DN5679_c0_g1_i1:360-1193(+)
MGAFQVIALRRTSEKSWEPFANLSPSFIPFRDASVGDCSYKMKILDVLKGLEYATALGWFNMRTFNVREYEYYEQVENGDLNWIIPNKFLAFSGPASSSMDREDMKNWTPEDYVHLFRRWNVKLVVRLNKSNYDPSRFTKHGIRHLDLYFPDGSCPDQQIVAQFLRECENEPGAIAVHCKAGLGRTGTLIACYAMKHYGFNAAHFIGWIRLCRPGSILGPQQQFLIEQQETMLRHSSSSVWKEINEGFESSFLERFHVFLFFPSLMTRRARNKKRVH